MSSIREAEQWAFDVWQKASRSWNERKQDFNYRKYLTRPALERIVDQLPMIKDGKFVDIGCGEGNETFELGKMLSRKGHSGTMYAFDPQSRLIDHAKERAFETNDMAFSFQCGEYSKFVEDNGLKGRADIATSFFALQDLPDIKGFLGDFSSIIKPGGHGILLFLHPGFADMMREKGAMRVCERLGLNPGLWDYAGEYPIVEEDERTFFVPYFHRELSAYKRIISEHLDDIKVTELKPDDGTKRLCAEKRLSPFYRHRGNAYYPEIVQVESSIFVIGKKK